MVSQCLIAIGGNMILAQAMDYIKAHLEKPITLPEVAAHIFRSESTLSHLFQEKLGKSFMQTVIELKLDKAEDILRSVLDITVIQALAKVGYGDSFHFSTLFKKYKGYAPSRCKKR